MMSHCLENSLVVVELLLNRLAQQCVEHGGETVEAASCDYLAWKEVKCCKGKINNKCGIVQNPVLSGRPLV